MQQMYIQDRNFSFFSVMRSCFLKFELYKKFYVKILQDLFFLDMFLEFMSFAEIYFLSMMLVNPFL